MIKQRTCIACRAKKSKDDLIRIISDGGIAKIDDTKKANTRGIYICDSMECINKLLRLKDLTKCIKIKVTNDSFKELLKNLGE